MQRICAVIACLAAIGRGAHADTIVSAEITASSTFGGGTLHAGWRAFDADTNTAWCQAVSDDAAGGSIVVRFAQPVTVRSIELHGVERDRVDPDAALPPLALTMTSDERAPLAVSFEPTIAPTPIAPPAVATRSLRFHLAPRPAGARALRDVCLSEIHIELVDGRLVFGVPPRAVAALPAALTTLTDAFVRCDRKQLARLAEFPVGLRETAMGHRRAYETGKGTDTDPRAFRGPGALPCGWAVFRDDLPKPATPATPAAPAAHPDVPTIDEGIAPGVVRIIGGVATTTVYWELAWRDRSWQLISLDTVFFE